jgi:hypothetical protein
MRLWMRAAGLLAIATCVFWSISVERSSTTNATRDSLASTFPSDIRNLVYRWDPNDPTLERERQAALFAFVHETYETSAWIPQAVFDGNLITQVVAGDVNTIVRDQVGLVLWPENRLIPAYGMAPGRVGQVLYRDRAWERLAETDLIRRFGSDRDWFNTERVGSGNGGHDMWPRIRTDANRRALIEYLTTL